MNMNKIRLTREVGFSNHQIINNKRNLEKEMISLIQKKYQAIAMIALIMTLAFIVGCAEQGTMTKDEDMTKESGESMRKEGSGY